MRVLIDADMPAHELGHIKIETGKEDEDGKKEMILAPFKSIVNTAKGRFISIIINAEAGGFRAWLTRGKCFRHELATIRPYKGQREDLPRDNVDLVKDMFHEEYGAEWCEGYEADDALSMKQWEEYDYLSKMSGGDEEYIQRHSTNVIASRDKDLDTVPGWHYHWALKRGGKQIQVTYPYWVSLIEALRNFYKQCLMGDVSDNIPGLYNVGAKSAWVKQLNDMDNEPAMYEHVYDKYTKYFGLRAREFFLENARLLWMWRKKNDVYLPPGERDSKWYDLSHIPEREELFKL